MSRDPISVVCWKWSSPNGPNFGPEYVNRLRCALKTHLQLPHQLYCFTNDTSGIHPDVKTFPILEFTDTPRCRRRMKQFDSAMRGLVGPRMLSIDLDVVIVDDITAIVDRPEPLVCWKVAYANVFSGSFLLMDTGHLHHLYERFAADPEGYPAKVQPRGVPSDQAMLNHFLEGRPVPHWTEADGFVTYFGEGYERLAHHGVGPNNPELPEGARIVVLGSADKHVMDEGRYPWVREHWSRMEVFA